MTKEQIKHVEEQLIKFIDLVVENTDATPAELEALPKVASVLVAMNGIY